MELLAVIENAWGWTGLRPSEVIGDNDFGNLLIKDFFGSFWRLCPEDLYCKVVATSQTELDRLAHSPEFLEDWSMTILVQKAHLLLGALRPGYKYCLTVPSVLGGEYGGNNLATVPLRELVAVSGHLAQQIQDLPDGAQVKLSVVK